MAMELIYLNDTDNNDYNSELDNYGYENLAHNIKDDVIAVWKFLCTEALVLQGVRQFAEQYYAYNRDEKRTLRQFFDDWGSKNHFNQVSDKTDLEPYQTSPDFQYPAHTPILYGELTPDLFLNVLLKHGYLSGDIGAGPVHGKWVHSIQLFILEEARKSGKLTLHSKSVCDFVKTISQIKPLFNGFHLWDILFDSFDENIYTHPNNITSLLIKLKDSEATQFLSKKLIDFKKKFDEAFQTGDYNTYAKRKYLSRISEAQYVSYGEKCSLLWFAPKSKISGVHAEPNEVVKSFESF